MTRLTSLGELKQLKTYLDGEQDAHIRTLVIPAGTCGRASGADVLIQTVRDRIEKDGLAGKIQVRVTGCHGFCEMEPSILVEPEGVFYPRIKPAAADDVVQAAARGEILEEHVWADPRRGARIAFQRDVPFFKKQKRTILARNEQVAPEDINAYIANEGYGALLTVLERRDPHWALEQVKASGLRGRGGAGFPTGIKWEMMARQANDNGKFLVCNADEGDPGAYMDRSILEGNPHSILEGMLIGAYATGATDGILYVRAEYPLAIKHLHIALEQAQALGLLGEHILGTDFSFHIRIVQGAGAFVCGEETALIRSIEGHMGEPKQRPPFPIQSGINGRPTSINNVETWANIPIIIMTGAERFAEIGAQNNSGTKIFSLVGKIRNTGLVEVPMGITIAEIVRDIGGGPVGNATIKAVQTGGPSGGCIPASRFDLPIDYDSLAKAGSIMGSGGMIVMDDSTCIVDVARYFMGFLKDESCGKCFACRKGTQRMYEILDDVSQGKGAPEHLDLLEELALVVKDTTMCGLGQTAANPVLSTLRYFRDEYLAHIDEQCCPAGVCKALISYHINDNCTGCQLCLKKCPADAIHGEKKARQYIDATKCLKCGACRSVCRQDAVEVV